MDFETPILNRLILTSIFRTNLVRGPWNKEMKCQNKGAVLVQIAPLFIYVAPLFINQPHSQNQSIPGPCFHLISRVLIELEVL